jgi:LIVCS family branched-chain amino acid:cation transporter
VVVGAVIIVSLNFKNMEVEEPTVPKHFNPKIWFLCRFGLVYYAGLISVGAYYGSEININEDLSNDMQRQSIKSDIASLGEFGNTVLSILISLYYDSCGCVLVRQIIFKGYFQQFAIRLYHCNCCMYLQVVVGQLDFNSIIVVAIPVLLFIYPITIVLIFAECIYQKEIGDTFSFRPLF